VDEEHGEVVALRGLTHKCANSVLHGFQMLCRRAASVQDLFHAFLAKQLGPGVFGLRKAVGEDERWIVSGVAVTQSARAKVMAATTTILMPA